MIEIKDPEVLIGLLKWQYHSKLQELMYWVVTHYSNVTLTEGYRKQRHRNDLHGTIPVRAIDIRSWNFPDPGKIEDRINGAWEYDPTRPGMKCAVFHDSGEGPHFHLQVHKRTRMRE